MQLLQLGVNCNCGKPVFGTQLKLQKDFIVTNLNCDKIETKPEL